MTDRPTLLFVSPQFLFPMDAGGKIRSANLLKALKGGAFRTRLSMPASLQEEERWRRDIAALADEATLFRPAPRLARRMRRAIGFLASTPISAFADADRRTKSAVRSALARKPDIVVFDYAQSVATAPAKLETPHLIFAHNVETEILERHAKIATGAMRLAWRREARKMRRFEERACAASDGVIAVSERDARIFRDDLGARFAAAIPTGVDAGYFAYEPPAESAAPHIVFTGSLDWKANQDALSWFMEAIWPRILKERPDASFAVVGKNPPRAMVEAAKARAPGWRFTGFVDDIRPHARGACFVIPLRVGGGTRIKAFEAMAMGTPVVATARGVEGLPVAPDEHFLQADDAEAFAIAVLSLLGDAALRLRLARAARRLVEDNFSHEAAARIFEKHCLASLSGRR